MTTTLESKGTHCAPRRVEYVIPAVDIREEGDAFVLEADMPGVGKDSLEITLEDSELTILGHRSQEKTAGNALLQEQRQASYRRVFEIDQAICGERIAASLNQGRLTVTLPISERVKPRKITVEG